jgi:hypothetical protein
LLFLLRYYGLPEINNYMINGLASLPFEKHLTEGLSSLSTLFQ